jgi:hypothetical protein
LMSRVCRSRSVWRGVGTTRPFRPGRIGHHERVVAVVCAGSRRPRERRRVPATSLRRYVTRAREAEARWTALSVGPSMVCQTVLC